MNDSATYCPEDNKLRLYVGRVPRDEYLELKAEGWTSTPKQSCDFVATWTPARRDRALKYAEIIEDEDAGPEERAADRAERFGEYRDKRLDEATGHADTFDAGPSAHGFQNQARAERSARRHDRQAGYACDAWSKAEYWTRRTAGVISHALHSSRPDVRMGRIKVLEAELRRFEKSPEHYPNWIAHTRLRIAYENQMLEAQGGRAAHVEMVVGGFFRGAQIHKINKSPATGRVTSVAVRVPRVTGWSYKVANEPGTDFALMTCDTERYPADAYRPPTPEDLETLKTFTNQVKAARVKHKEAAGPCPLINPTDEDAERLQAILNTRAHESLIAEKARRGWAAEFKPATVLRMTQAHYSQLSKGSSPHCATRDLFKTAELNDGYYGSTQRLLEKHGKPVCTVRQTYGDGQARRIIVIADKPQKPFPADLWPKPAAPAFALEVETVTYAERVEQLEGEGLSTSDAQGVADMELAT